MASRGAADRAFAVGRKLGQELLCFFFAAIGTNGVFSLRVQGLQEHEFLAACFTAIFVKRHDRVPPEKALHGACTRVTLAGAQNVKI